uniref:Uncharacterized protein n=1 Tax=Nelumbo nucifera TaxID=4432 RepID=A0A822ZS83_NELNU|nr:TPA_asm: hypothetical protein HUJ06_002938 [Nelumbo nucifera]
MDGDMGVMESLTQRPHSKKKNQSVEVSSPDSSTDKNGVPSPMLDRLTPGESGKVVAQKKANPDAPSTPDNQFIWLILSVSGIYNRAQRRISVTVYIWSGDRRPSGWFSMPTCPPNLRPLFWVWI